jgi:hypothetical protein
LSCAWAVLGKMFELYSAKNNTLSATRTEVEKYVALFSKNEDKGLLE